MRFRFGRSCHFPVRMIVIGLILFLGMVFIGTVGGKTWIVDDDWAGADHDNIQDALDECENGDLIRIYAGTYHEDININRSVSLSGNGTGNSYIKGKSHNRIITVEAANVSIEGISVYGNSKYIGIIIEEDDFTLKKTDVSFFGTGIFTEYTDGHHLEGCRIFNNTGWGMRTQGSCNNITILNCSIFNNSDSGLRLSSYSYHIIVRGCSIYGNHIHGAYIPVDDGSIVEDCVVHHNQYDGFHISGPDNIVVRNNHIHNNSEDGIDIAVGDSVHVYGNTICDNDAYGLELTSSIRIHIYWNTFKGNNKTPQGFQDGDNDDEHWDNGSVGNYWSDYNGTDSDGDGIGDISYELNGDANASDDHPLMAPWNGSLHPYEPEHDGKLSGYVEDGSGDPIKDVLISLEYHDRLQQTKTDTNGSYVMNDIWICNCTKKVTAYAQGYRSVTSSIGIGNDTWHNITMEEVHTWTVDDDNGSWAEYNTIQGAIDNSRAGDTILVYNGTYTEDLLIEKKLTIIGNGTDRTTIISYNRSITVDVQSSNCVIKNILVSGDEDGIGIWVERANISLLRVDVKRFNVGVRIEYSSGHQIKECDFYENGDYGFYTTDDCNNMTLEDCSMFNNTERGLGIGGYTYDNTIRNCSIYSNGKQGAYLNAIHKGTVFENCEVFDNGLDGFHVHISYGVTFRNNVFHNNSDDGLDFNYDAIDVTIYGNLFRDNGEYGVELGAPSSDSSRENMVYWNTFINNGKLSQAYDNKDDDNLWDNGSVGNYWSDYDGSDTNGDGIGDEPYNIGGNSDITDRYPLIAPWSGPEQFAYDTWIVDDDNGSWADFDNIPDAMDAAENGDKIRVFNGTYKERLIIEKSLKVVGNGSSSTKIDARKNWRAVSIRANMVRLTGFEITGSGNDQEAIHVFSDMNTISDCNVHNNTEGSGIVINGSNNLIEDNLVSKNFRMGISISGEYNLLINNKVIRNTKGGIIISDGSYNHICFNTIKYNNGWEAVHPDAENGIKLKNGSDHNIIDNNTMVDQDFYGVNVPLFCEYNEIYLNNLIDNNDGGVQAFDRGSHTKWDTGTYGNYWSDYDGEDSDEDGIGDTPYSIDGDNSTDRYPLMKLWNGSFVIGSPRTWIVDDDNGSWADFDNVQLAIDSAKLGDMIRIYSGSYIGNISLKKQLMLIGNRSTSTFIDLDEEGSHFKVNADNVVIRNVTVIGDSGSLGATFDAEKCNRLIIKDSQFLNSSGYCALFSDCIDIQLFNCTFRGSTRQAGIRFHTCQQINIQNCSISENAQSGILMYGDTGNGSINSSSFHSNERHGLELRGTHNLTIQKCSISANNESGIYLQSTRHNLIRYNRIENNSNYGVYVYDTPPPNGSDDLFENNDFIDNSPETAQASTDNNVSYWDNGSVGNYWSDYDGTDSDGDGIGDTPYYLDGDGNATDRYPLMKPWSDEPDDVEWENPGVLSGYVKDEEGSPIKGAYVYLGKCGSGQMSTDNQGFYRIYNVTIVNCSIRVNVTHPDFNPVTVYKSIGYDSWANFTMTKDRTWIVDDNNGSWADHRYIEDAIEDASNGDTIRIYAGRYIEDLFISKSLTLIGNGSTTRIESSLDQTPLKITADHVSLTDLNISIMLFPIPKHDGAIEIDRVNNTVLRNCILETTREYTVWMDQAKNVRVESCNFDGSYSGIGISYSRRINVSACSFKDLDRVAIDINDASGIVISDCIMSGINDEAVQMNKAENVHLNDSHINNNGEAVSVHDSSGVFVHNTSMLNNSQFVVTIYDCNTTVLWNCMIDGGRRGIWVRGDNKNTLIANCSITNITQQAVDVDKDSMATEILFTYVANNDCPDGNASIYAGGEKTRIGSCNISSNDGDGIVVVGNDCVIWNSVIQNNDGDGIIVGDTTDCVFKFNNISENAGIGINLRKDASGHLIHDNSFIDNDGTSQAKDDNGHNDWDNGYHGNYWSDYVGIDADNDSIGDTPYIIPGTGNKTAKDNYPLMDPVELDVDTQRPVVQIISPANGTKVSGNVTIHGRVIDNMAVTFVWYRFSGDVKWLDAVGNTSFNVTIDTSDLKKGKFTVEFIAFDGTLFSNVTKLTLHYNGSGSKGDKDGSDDDDSGVPIPPLPVSIGIGAAISLSIIGMFAMTETGKYLMIGAVAAMYARMKDRSKDEVLENFVRGQIFGYIRTNPGVYYTEIMKSLGIKNGTLSYHLKTLEGMDLVKSRREGARRRAFYPTTVKFPADEQYMYSELQIEILKVIKENPGIAQHEVARKLKKPQQTVNYNIKAMQRAEKLKLVRKGRSMRCYLK